MNWTEGKLARGRKRNEVLERQRQHFAKARRSLTNSRVKQSPPSITFLESAVARGLIQEKSLASDHQSLSSNPALRPKRKHSCHHPNATDAYSPSHYEKRRKLLEKSDWTGLSLQQPLDIAFPGQIHAAGGSRWSKPDRPRERLSSRLRKFVSTRKAEEKTSERVARQPINIKIGSHEMQSSFEPYSPSHQVSAGSLERSTCVARNQRKHPLQHIQSTDLSSQELRRAPRVSHHEQRNIQRCSVVARSATETAVQPETPAHSVCASPNIHAPAPLRANNFSVLQWSPGNSQDTGSLHVEIERPGRLGPPTETTDQRVWRDWILSDIFATESGPSTQETVRSMSLSPSATSSNSMLPSHLKMRLPSFDVSSEAPRSPRRKGDVQSDSSVVENSQGWEGTMQDQSRNIDQNPHKPDDSWTSFASGDDSDGIQNRAFKEAVRQVVLELQPSENSDAISQDNNQGATTLETGSPTDDIDNGDHGLIGSSTPSNAATKGTEFSGFSSDETAASDHATLGTVDESRRPHRWTMPKAFVGKIKGLLERDNTASLAFAKHPVKARDTQSDRKLKAKKARAGWERAPGQFDRTSIRDLPDFDGDPIDEFED
ncbi:hypothetical protein F5Y15DRAFT_422147 [Xylariaceae sp. FL0016]|nr:hypothetical protein F5Y15DRAFT_422147 [Xylariaceae sp. FL0016]